jgi:hypothetical protein
VSRNPLFDRVAERVARLAISLLLLTRDGTLRLDDPSSMGALVKYVLVSNRS